MKKVQETTEEFLKKPGNSNISLPPLPAELQTVDLTNEIEDEIDEEIGSRVPERDNTATSDA